MEILIYIIVALAIALIVISFFLSRLSKKVSDLTSKLSEERSRRQSQSTRYGQLSEQFMPLLEDYPGDPKEFRFLGSPIDGVGFEEDRILLTEFKVASSQLTTRQRRIRDMVKDNKVEFVEVRISEKEK